MKKILIGLSLLFLIGCAGMDRGGCFESVSKAFPKSQIVVIDKYGYKFLVKDQNGKIFYVETMNQTNTDITLKRELF